MKTSFTVLVVLTISSVGLAQGTVRIFLSNSADSAGLTVPGNAFNPTGGAHDNDDPYFRTDASDWGAGNGVEYEVTGTPAWDIPAPDPACGEFAYIWLSMDDIQADTRIQSIEIGWGPAEDIADVAYYVMDDTDGWSGFAGEKRWNGAYTMPGEPEFKNNPQVLAAVTAWGLKNSGTAQDAANLQAAYEQGSPPPPITADSTYLLGAIAFEPGWQQIDGFLGGAPGEVNLSFQGEYQPDEIIITGAWCPEPASILLLGLAGLMIRRR